MQIRQEEERLRAADLSKPSLFKELHLLRSWLLDEGVMGGVRCTDFITTTPRAPA